MAPEVETAQREPLSRDRVVDAAVDLTDHDGIEALSMRNLADTLGVVPMALYKHVEDKDDLVDAMVDVVFSEAEFFGAGDWRTAMRARAVALRNALRRHPWAIGLMETRTPGPANLRHHNAVMGCLRVDADLPFWMAVHVLSIMDSYVYGFALQERTLPVDIPSEADERLQAATERDPNAADQYPHLVEIAVELGRSGYDYAQEFEFGLDVVLDGIERVTTQPSPAPNDAASNDPAK